LHAGAVWNSRSVRLQRIAACALLGSALAAPGRRLVAHSGPVAILAVLIGVNIGPNLTYVGSLSNLL